MRSIGSALLGVVFAGLVCVAGALAYARATGLGARGEAGALEVRLARAARHFAIPPTVRGATNPVPASPEVLAEGLAHYADHCASCHGNDGSGDTEMGRGLFPRAPDMRLPATQQLSDGELFYVIENGIRFTGMPAWGTATASGEESTWQLVRFVRHLPQVTRAELERMKSLNPRSPEDIRQEIEEDRFLNQGAP
jgi:mono/diheme cytochrome c family protein